LERHLAAFAFNWSALYNMTSTESMTNNLYDVTTSLLEHYLPLRSVKHHSADKPWIRLQMNAHICSGRVSVHAWTQRNTAEYKCHRNVVNHLSVQLRKRFHKQKIDEQNATANITQMKTYDARKHQCVLQAPWIQIHPKR